MKQPTGSPGPGSRVALRNWRISTRLVSLLALPVVAATSLGALRISDSMTDIQQLDNMKLLTDMTKQATELATALQEERDQSAGPLSHGGKATDYQVKGYQQKTDRARDNFINASEEVDSASKSGNLQGVRESLVGLATELDNLDKIRKSAYQSKENSTQTVDAYHRLITQLLDLSQDMAEATSNPEMIQRTRALAAFSAAKEFSSVQRAVIAAALPNNNTQLGKLSDNDRLYADSALESEKSELSIFRNIYGTQGAEELIAPIEDGNPTIESADTYAQRVLDNANGLSSLDKRSYKDWVDDSSTKIEQMKKIEHTLLEDMEQKARELRSASEREAIISGALILLVLGVSLVGAFVIARSMIRSLRRLQETANKVAQDRLPELVKQLSESDPQDVDTSVESVGVHSRDEIGQVAAAFDDVHREAVRLAAEQALLRGNVNAMFTNLSRRSQGLIQRQLSLISELESREADPDQLSSLFKLDHLATRMRRNGENLLVLAGEEPGRRWTRPVPLVDVLRAAASEVEQYERIELASVPTTEVAGRVVNDLVHLLAELLENATSFSSPQTKVKVTGHALPDGRVLIEIHDTGIGLSPEDLAAINERLASPPTVDVSVSRRMGLFVVGRLSQRHGIRIQLRPSDSGGTTALVMLPVDVAQGGKKPAPGKPGQAAVGAAAAQPPRPVPVRPAGATASRGSALGAGAPAGGNGGLLGAGAAPRGQVGAGQGPRAALPGAGGGRPGGPAGPGGPGGARGPQGPSAPQGRQNTGGGLFGQAPAAPQGLQATGAGGARASVTDVRTPSAVPRRRTATRFRRSARATTSPSRPAVVAGAVDGSLSSRPAVVPGPSCRAATTASSARVGATRTRSPRWAAATSTPRAVTTSATPSRPPGCPASTTVRAPRPRRRCRRYPASTHRTAASSRARVPTGSRTRASSRVPAPTASRTPGSSPAGRERLAGHGLLPRPGAGSPRTRARSRGRTSTPRVPAPTPRRTAGSSSARTSSVPRTARPTTRRIRPTRDSSPSRRPTTPAPPGSSRTPALTTGPPVSTICRTVRTPRTPGSSNVRRSTGTATVPTTAPSDRPPRSVPPARSPRRCRLPRVPVTAGRRCTTRWRPTGSTASRRNSSRARAATAPRPPRSRRHRRLRRHPQRPTGGTWRSSPNDDLVRQAERVRQPAAGGVTTSGLPRRVPRANLVPGTAQQQQHQTGPQVSRAPDDVRGRLTNLRRGIAQGRQAGTGTGQTGSFPSPTHQQER